MFEFSIRQYADVSTAYVEQSDLPLLLNQDAPGHIANIDEDYGAIFHVVIDDPGIFDERMEEYRKLGFSEKFLAIIRDASEQQIQYIRFDADGDDLGGAEKGEYAR